MTFDANVTEVNIRYGMPYISHDVAQSNLKRDDVKFNWQEQSNTTNKIWNSALGMIQVWGGDDNDASEFYTSFFRVYERMINTSDSNGYYYSSQSCSSVRDERVPFFNDDWIWDTYRAAHPLRVLIDAETECAMSASYVRMAKSTAEMWLPTFPEVYYLLKLSYIHINTLLLYYIYFNSIYNLLKGNW
ncbi:hypothetical protein EZS27_032747 [termite gut metagenome]|uniref:Glycosyl hydrolase family 92 domain-containing protein n=1 Tax=termite gut metagenome TaxID=433724 RepID=A0A5J4Q5W3_9ZZZZ